MNNTYSGTSSTLTGSRQIIAGIFILVMAVLLRVSGLDWGLPKSAEFENSFYVSSFMPDEGQVLYNCLHMLSSGELLPPIAAGGYLQSYFALVMVKTAHLFNLLPEPQIPPAAETTYSVLYLMRWMSAITGVFFVIVVFLLGKEVCDPMTGILVSLICSILPFPVIASHFVKNDIFMVSACGLGLYFWFKYLHVNKTRWVILSGLFMGIGTAFKYSGIFLLIVPLTFIFLPRKWVYESAVNKFRSLLLLFLSFIAGFLPGCPSVILDFNHFYGAEHFGALYLQTHSVVEGSAWINNALIFARSLGLPLMGFFIISVILIIRERWGRGHLIFAWCAILFVFMCVIGSKYPRFQLMLVPFICLILARGYTILKKKVVTKPVMRIINIILLAVLVYTFLYTAGYVRLMHNDDVRIKALKGINKKIPAGSKLGIFRLDWTYPPPLDKDRYIISIYNLGEIQHGLTWKNLPESQQIDYYIISSDELDLLPADLWKNTERVMEFSNPPTMFGIQYHQNYRLLNFMFYQPDIFVYKNQN